MKSVYIETSIISYLAARPSRDLIIAAHQQLTHDWWQCSSKYELVVSELVVTEASKGDASAAKQRLALLEGVNRLALSEQAHLFAQQMIFAKLIPKNEMADALHIAVAAASGIDFLLTWNCAHIANAAIRPKIDDWFRVHGITPPTICTPEELLGK